MTEQQSGQQPSQAMSQSGMSPSPSVVLTAIDILQRWSYPCDLRDSLTPRFNE